MSSTRLPWDSTTSTCRTLPYNASRLEKSGLCARHPPAKHQVIDRDTKEHNGHSDGYPHRIAEGEQHEQTECRNQEQQGCGGITRRSKATDQGRSPADHEESRDRQHQKNDRDKNEVRQDFVERSGQNQHRTQGRLDRDAPGGVPNSV